MKIPIDELIRKHCDCKSAENKIILEAVMVCPGCFTFFSKVLADIPAERIPEVLERILSVVKEMGLLKETEPVVLEGYKRSHE